MAIARPGSPEVAALLEALGLDGKKVTGLDIRIRPNELVTVTVSFGAEAGALEQLADTVKRYDLVEKQPQRTVVHNFAVGDFASREQVEQAVLRAFPRGSVPEFTRLPVVEMKESTPDPMAAVRALSERQGT